MKKFFVAAAAALMMTSCSGLYVDITTPLFVEGHNNVGNKVGVSSYNNILNIIVTGDAGINAAARNANIKKISHVDQQKTSFLGLFGTVKTKVYGE